MLVNYSSSEDEESDGGRKRRRSGDEAEEAACSKRGKPGTRNDQTGDLKKQPSRTNESGTTCQGSPHILPVPTSILEMFQEDSVEQAYSHSSRHGGRIRSFRHERGNWATYVYLPYLAESDFEELADRLISAAGAHGISLTRMADFHISLSQTVVLRHHWIEPFVLSLKEALAPFSRRGVLYLNVGGTVAVLLPHNNEARARILGGGPKTCRFLCVADRLNVYANQEKTRTFLGLEVTLGQDELVHLVGAVDKTLEAFRLATFYQDPSFHVSLAWCVGDYKERLEGLCAQLQGIVHDSEDGGELTRLWAEDIRCKSGNKVFSFQLH